MKKIILLCLFALAVFANDINGTLKACVNSTLKKADNHTPTNAELLTIKSFTCNYAGTLHVNALRRFKNLRRLELRGNLINSSIPAWIGELKSLETLILTGNNLSGTIPKEIGNLTSLKVLDLSVNHLHSIPSDISKLKKLEVLELASAGLGGTIPKEIGSLTSLKKLYLQDNAFINTIPKEIGNLTKLKRLRLNHNNLRGTIPLELKKLNLNQPSGLNLQGNCRLVTKDANLTAWINKKSSFYGGYAKVKSTGGRCPLNPAIIMYLLD